MIIVLVKYICKPGCRELFLQSIKEKGIDSASRNEQGNVKYEYSVSIEEKNELLLTELWSDMQVLEQHGQTPHFKALGELKKQYVENTEIVRYKGQMINQ